MSFRPEAGLFRRDGMTRGSEFGGGLSPLLGLTDFATTTTYLQTATPGGVEGIATGFWVACLFSVLTQAVAGQTRTLVSRCNTGITNGWELRTAGANTSCSFVAASAALAGTASPAATIPAGHVGKDILMVGVHTGAGGRLNLYFDRNDIGGGAPIVGYAPSSATAMRVSGRTAAGLAATSVTVYGSAGGHGVPTLAQVQAYFDAVKLSRGILPVMAGVTTQGVWNTRTNILMSDSVGVDHLNAVGTPTLVAKANPNFSW